MRTSKILFASALYHMKMYHMYLRTGKPICARVEALIATRLYLQALELKQIETEINAVIDQAA